ncbi:hypothetical protein DL98DRAFT_515921 [Cadophora sp. DSE1049]|nr:hypothetical protein DL98DRAFT_515921 [Cadophora sp. DSE1049]
MMTVLKQFLETGCKLLTKEDNDRLIIISEFLTLYFLTSVTSKILSSSTPRFNTLPSYRQRQLSIIPPIITFKLLIITLFIYASTNILNFSTPSLDKLFRIVNHITFGYIFEILYRPSPALLQSHQIFLQGLSFHFILYLRYQPHYLLILRLCSVIIVFGVGWTNSFVDLMVLACRLAPLEKKWSRMLVRSLGFGSEVARRYSGFGCGNLLGCIVRI